MKVLVVNNMAPFSWGGAEELAVHLRSALMEAGHESEVLRLPFQWEPATRIPSQMLMVKGLELVNVDRVIALKFPAYLIRHRAKTLWLLHQYRQAYDLYEAGMSNISKGEQGESIRAAIRAGDDEAFGECERIFVNSEVTGDRLARFSGVRGEVLRPPLNDPELFVGGPSENYIFAGGRVNAMKRQHILLEALALTSSKVRLVIAGPPDDPADASRLRQLVEEHGLGDRVLLDLGFLPRATVAQYVNRAAAIACLPYDEDSLSYVAMEGAAAGKPLLTTTDSGGVLGLVRHLETGWSADPSPGSIAAGLEALAGETPRTIAMGQSARDLWLQLGSSWPQVVDRLLS